jgi:hypothetical protein
MGLTLKNNCNDEWLNRLRLGLKKDSLPEKMKLLEIEENNTLRIDVTQRLRNGESIGKLLKQLNELVI